MSSASQNVQQAVDWGTCSAPVGSEGHYFTNGTIFILFSHRKTPKFARFTTERFIVRLRDGFPVLWKTWNVFILLFNTTRRMFLIPGVNWRDAQPKICVSTTRKKKKKGWLSPGSSRGRWTILKCMRSLCDWAWSQVFQRFFLWLNVA